LRNISYRIVIADLYGCETCPLTLREEHGVRVFENWVLRKVFRLKREEETWDWRKFHSEVHDLYSSLNIFRVIK
jgi:hypothetical protein